MSQLANWVHGIAKSIAKRSGSEPAVILDDTSIKIHYEKPDSNDKRVWDREYYDSGNIFYAGYANALKLEKEKQDKEEWIASDRHKTFMKMKAIRDAFLGKSERNEKLMYVIYGIIVLQSLTILGLMAIGAAL